MDAKELAAKLNGALIGEEICGEDAKRAAEAGLVVMFGASDDLVELRGAIDDEVSAYQGAEITVDREGLLPGFDDLDKYDKDALRAWFNREGKGKVIEALWDQEEPYSWSFKAEIPHETFDILEDGKLYCRGIVFRLKDASDA